MAAVEITVTFDREMHRFVNADGDVIVARVNWDDPDANKEVDGSLSVLGPDLTFERRQSYLLFGYWSRYRGQPQFRFSSGIRVQPHDRAGIIAYLVSAGRGKNLGEVRATAIWEQYGTDAVKVLRKQPEKVSKEVAGVSKKSAETTAEQLKLLAKTENCSIDLMSILDRRGFPKATLNRCLDEWGNQAAGFLKRNPYLLMRFPGCGFKRTDAMYLDLGLNPGKIKRQALCAWHFLNSDSDGHTWFAAARAIRAIEEGVGAATVKPTKALKLAKRSGIVATMRWPEKGGELFLAEGHKARDEKFIADCLVESMDQESRWPTVDEINEVQPEATAHQLEQIDLATRDGTISIFGGSPGTGKTFMAAALVSALRDKAQGFAVCAPTGKAAVRVTEAMFDHGLKVTARTIHSLLRVKSVNGGWVFHHGRGNPLPYRFIIVDEASMISVDLLASLLAAWSKGTHIMFIGDVNQLPPVGHGAPLRDMIDAGLPCGELKEIRRNSGRIVKACAQIRDVTPFEVSEEIDLEAGENLVLYRATTPEEQIVGLKSILLSDNNPFDPVWETQVVCPVNAKSLVSRRALNVILQELLNPHGTGLEGISFRVGDKIVNTRNGLWPADLKKGLDYYVANGELAQVTDVEPKFIIAELSNPDRRIRIPMGPPGKDENGEPTTGCSWELGFALSVHKSQGSAWPCVCIILDTYPGAKMVVDRSWLYTAISRAEKMCFLVGTMATAEEACYRTKIRDRKTFLSELVNRERNTRILTEL